jgi:hypothetical protein
VILLFKNYSSFGYFLCLTINTWLKSALLLINMLFSKVTPSKNRFWCCFSPWRPIIVFKWIRWYVCFTIPFIFLNQGLCAYKWLYNRRMTVFWGLCSLIERLRLIIHMNWISVGASVWTGNKPSNFTISRHSDTFRLLIR